MKRIDIKVFDKARGLAVINLVFGEDDEVAKVLFEAVWDALALNTVFDTGDLIQNLGKHNHELIGIKHQTIPIPEITIEAHGEPVGSLCVARAFRKYGPEGHTDLHMIKYEPENESPESKPL